MESDAWNVCGANGTQLDRGRRRGADDGWAAALGLERMGQERG